MMRPTEDKGMSEKPFQCELRVGWAHVDFNQHMGNSAYLDLATDSRTSAYTELPPRGRGAAPL